jgi:hypothetical protein
MIHIRSNTFIDFELENADFTGRNKIALISYTQANCSVDLWFVFHRSLDALVRGLSKGQSLKKDLAI